MSPWMATGWFPTLPHFVNPLEGLMDRVTFDFGMLYEKNSKPTHPTQRSSPLVWLLVTGAAATMVSLVVMVSRRWQRRAYREVNDVPPDVRVELNVEPNDV